MSNGKLLALKRKRESFAAAGITGPLAQIDAWIQVLEDGIAEQAEAQSAQVEAETEQAEVLAGVVLTPAAQQRADELGLTPEDFEGHEPSGKGGFLVSDVQRIAEAKAHTEEEDDDGDD